MTMRGDQSDSSQLQAVMQEAGASLYQQQQQADPAPGAEGEDRSPILKASDVAG